MAAAIDSILGQTLSDLELIVVDDGSDDDTNDVLQALDDDRIRLVRRGRHGLVAALNDGVELAGSGVIARMDADDVALPERLALQYELLSHDRQVGLTSTAWMEVDSDGRDIGFRAAPRSHGEARFKLAFGNCLAHSTAMFRRDVFETVGGYRAEDFPAEDYGLWLRMIRRTRFAGVPSVQLARLSDPASVSGVRAVEQRARTVALAGEAIEQLTGHSAPQEILAILAGFEPPPDEDGSLAAAEVTAAVWAATQRECRATGAPTEGLVDALAAVLVRIGVRRSAHAPMLVRFACRHPSQTARLATRGLTRAVRSRRAG